MDCVSFLPERLLPLWCRSYDLYARTLLLVDWYLHAVEPSSMSTVPRVTVFHTDGALVHPLSPLAVRPWCRGERRLHRPPPRYKSGKLLHPTLHE